MKKTTKQAETGALRRVWLLPAILLIGVLLVFTLGKLGVLPGVNTLMGQIGLFAGSPWGLPVLIGVFCIGAFVGIPQFLLFGVAVTAFGPWVGGAYAWLATLVSASLTFAAGRFGGEALFLRFAGVRGHKVSQFLGENAFKASAVVRLVPAGPFILVNMAFGVSKAHFLSFIAGLGVGAVPKLTLVALIAQGAVAAGSGSFWGVGIAIAGGLLIIAWLIAFRRG